MSEHIILVFKDGSHFDLDAGNIWNLKRVLGIRRKLGDPVEIIGDGTGARRLRERYKLYNADRENYKSDVVGGLSELGGMTWEEAKEKFESVKKKLKL